MTLSWAFALLGLGLVFGATAGIGIMGVLHGPTCQRLQDAAYDKGWDTAVLVRSGVLRGQRWQDSGRTSQLADTGQMYLQGAAEWVTRHLDTQAHADQAECGGHHCLETDQGLICQAQLGGVCPTQADQRVARSVQRALGSGGLWRTVKGLAAHHAGAHV